MTAIAAPCTAPSASKRALFFIVVLALVAGLMAIPLNSHARRSHAKEAYNATSIREHIVEGSYSRMEAWRCPVPGNVHTKLLIEVKSVWAGLIIRHKADRDVIITGFAAPRFYWDMAIVRDGCAPIPLP